MKQRIQLYMAAALLLLSAGCSKDFFDINNNPNSATSTTPELVLPNALKVTVGTELTGFTYLCGWMCYWAPSGSYAISASDVASYHQTNDTYSGSWTTYYRNLEDYNYIEAAAKLQNKPFFIGAAKIMKAFVFQQLVDLYNDVPYTQALQGTSVITPKFDAAQSVYEAIATQLDSAVTYMQNPSATATANSDIMFGGSTSNWIAFANTLKLRILMRQTQMSGRASYIQAQIAKITANGGGFLTTDALVNPGYAASSGQQNPTYGYFVTLTGLPTSGGQADYWRAAQYSIAFMMNNNDIRYKYIYSPSSGGTYVGDVLGSLNNIPGSGSSSMGPGILKSNGQSAVMISLAESYFLQAEANLRGWLGAAGADATNFNNGVTASFAYLGASAGAADTLETQSGNKQTNYSACTTFDEKLACIIRQKWVAMNSITPFEAWSDYRRLGLPADIPISLSPYRDGPNIPVRVLYPTLEYTTNATNVGAEGTINGHTSKIFWMP
ncbi:SusD/RagB family nutrient-binding outer membrane lipoprotein [Puia dinghuensis]|uniref:SusD/RagB family nutrient-binding outer membrane lipoprotein n=1 Tax=Puia dinghuensis TaxID=1792502 RepID=A0A8J2UJ18_9BACT|nr:SusD/RagB family nutrient-binding outer membrane lipoprotein [Puia dinghuensis]GGB24931.1 hypothetical protein GCM10011511_56090 [Puia dinghuensis]